MKYRSVVSVILIFAMIISSTCFVFAGENENSFEEESNIVDQGILDNMVEREEIDESALKAFISSKAKNIPFTLTLINPKADWDVAKLEATKIIKEYYKDADDYTVKKGSAEIYTCDDFRIIELGKDDHLYTEESVEFTDTISPLFIKEKSDGTNTKESGEEKKDEISIKYYNTFINDGGSTLKSESIIIPTKGNANSEAWWERNYRSFGKYSGYKFLYSETSIEVRSSKVKVGGIRKSINWKKLIKKTIEGAVNTLVGGINGTASVVSIVFSALIGSYEPISITYGKASSSYVYNQIKGDLYHMIVYIQDKRNKIPGYAYYKWGSTDRYRYKEFYDIKMPTGYTHTGSIEYTEITPSKGPYNIYMKGYPKSKTDSTSKKLLMSNILSCYYMAGEVTYNENIDTRILVAKIKD